MLYATNVTEGEGLLGPGCPEHSRCISGRRTRSAALRLTLRATAQLIEIKVKEISGTGSAAQAATGSGTEMRAPKFCDRAAEVRPAR